MEPAFPVKAMDSFAQQIRNCLSLKGGNMTLNQISKMINSLQYRRKMSLTISNLESEIIAFLTSKNCQGKPVVIGSWEVFFDGQDLSISEAPVENSEQMELFERSCT